MSKIVIISLPAFGHLIPMLGPIAELVRRGNDVVVYNEADFEQLIRATGAKFVPYPPGILTMLDFAKALKNGNLINALELLLGATPPLTDFLLAAGPGSDITRFGAVPANFIVQQTFPQMPVLERTTLFITHAGLGSVHETLWNGVPFVAVPPHFEQLRNALPAARQGAGVILDDECYGRAIAGPQLQAAVAKVIADPSYRRNARRLGDGLRAGGGFAKVADVIEEVAAAR